MTTRRTARRRAINRPLIPRADERDPYSRIGGDFGENGDYGALWEVLPDSESSEFPPPEAEPVHNTVQVTFEESEAERRAVTRPPGYWKLRSGKFIQISAMEDTHLMNAILMCERNAQSRGRRASGGAYEELRQERFRREERIRHAREIQQFMDRQTAAGTALFGALTNSSMGINYRASGFYYRASGFYGDPVEPQPQPQPSHSVIEENRPTRRIKK